jgi:hypothetical protein
MEAIMPAQSSMHFYFNWAKERIDEMDAVLASLGGKSWRSSGRVPKQGRPLIADLHKKRDEFQKPPRSSRCWRGSPAAHQKANWKARGMASRSKSKICRNFRKAGPAKATFQNAAAAQLKAWRDAAEDLTVLRQG